MNVRKPKSNIAGGGGPSGLTKPLRRLPPRNVTGPHPREANRKVRK
jgi:hypothetical protein